MGVFNVGDWLYPDISQGRQSQLPLEINWDNNLTSKLAAVFDAANPSVCPATGRSWTLSGIKSIATTGEGIASVCSQAGAKYASRLQALPPSAGWTIATIAYPVSYASTNSAVLGFCETPGNSVCDRSILVGNDGGPGFAAYVYDGAAKQANVVGAATSGTLEIAVATCTSSLLSLYRKGAVSGTATKAVSNSGYAGYSSPEFCVGDASNVAAESNVVLGILVNRPWSVVEAKSWIDNPRQIFVPPPIDIWGPSAGGGVTIDCTTGNAVAAGISCAVTQDITIACAVGNAVTDGVTASLPVTITASVGNAVAAGATASVTQAVTINTTLGNAVAAGVTAIIELGTGITINASVGNAVAAGIAAAILQDVAVSCGVGNAVAAGVAASIALGGGPLILAGSMRHAATLSSSARLATTLRGSIAHV